MLSCFYEYIYTYVRMFFFFLFFYLNACFTIFLRSHIYLCSFDYIVSSIYYYDLCAYFSSNLYVPPFFVYQNLVKKQTRTCVYLQLQIFTTWYQQSGTLNVIFKVMKHTMLIGYSSYKVPKQIKPKYYKVARSPSQKIPEGNTKLFFLPCISPLFELENILFQIISLKITTLKNSWLKKSWFKYVNDILSK